jgi:hypothetical protein
MSAVVMEQALAASLADTRDTVRVVPRRLASRRPWRPRAAWVSVSQDVAVATLAEAPAEALVLVRSPEADPGAACVAAVARLLGRKTVLLPEPVDAALWVAGLAAEWCDAGLSELARAVAVACGVGAGHGALRRCAWREGGVAVPDLHPRVLGRWASRAWAPCSWCRSGGGLPGAPCATCAEPVPQPVPESPPIAQVVPLRRTA